MSRRLHTDARRAQLLTLGEALFSTRSYDDVSIDDIAAQAGVSKGLLYHYFGGKRAFYVAVLEQAAGHLLAAVAADPDLPPAERARAGLHAYLAFVDERAPAFTTLMRGGLGTDREVDAIVDATRAAFVDRVLDALPLPAPSPTLRLAARAWVGAVEAASLDWLEHRDVDRDTLVEVLLAGLQGLVGAVIAAGG